MISKTTATSDDDNSLRECRKRPLEFKWDKANRGVRVKFKCHVLRWEKDSSRVIESGKRDILTADQSGLDVGNFARNLRLVPMSGSTQFGTNYVIRAQRPKI